MKTRSRRKTPFFQSKRGFQAILGAVIALAGFGFVHYGMEAAAIAQHYSDEYVHPTDFYAEGCFAVVLIAGMTLMLSRVPGTAPRYRKASTGSAWFATRPDSGMRALVDSAKPWRRRRSPMQQPRLPGYNKLK